jgi:hypothetical protein
MSDDYDPANATFNLLHHIIEKGWQAGGVLGLAVVAPAMAFRASRSIGGKTFVQAITEPQLVLRAAGAGGVGFATLTCERADPGVPLPAL